MTRQSTAPLTHITLQSSGRSAREVARMVTEDGDLSPKYQRASVWSEDQRVALIRSWLTGVPIPAVILNSRWSGSWPQDKDGLPVDGHAWAVVDGKQRIETAIACFEGALAVPASWFDAEVVQQTEETVDGPYVRYTGLTLIGQRRMSNNAQLPVVESKVATLREEADLYLLLNGGGTPQTDGDMDNAAAVAVSGGR